MNFQWLALPVLLTLPPSERIPSNKTLQHSEGSVERTDRHFPVGRLSVGTEPSEPGHGDVCAEREAGSRPLSPVRRVQSPLPLVSASQALRLYSGGDGDICLKVRRLHCQWTRTQGRCLLSVNSHPEPGAVPELLLLTTFLAI